MFELVLFFDFIDTVPKVRQLSCSFLEKENYFLKILFNLDVSTIEVYMARKHSPLKPKERFNIHLKYPKIASDFIESLGVFVGFSFSVLTSSVTAHFF
jgi:hypothetical protein